MLFLRKSDKMKKAVKSNNLSENWYESMGRILHFVLRMRSSYFSFKSLSRSKVTLLDEILLNVIICY